MNRVTLSFDNGPTPGITEGVLEVLARHGLFSTFFVIGQRLEAPRNAALLQAISAAGHWIGNHTWSHSVAFGDRPDEAYAREEIDRAQALIGEFADQEKLFRPYGNYGLLGRHLFSHSALSYLREQGLHHDQLDGGAGRLVPPGLGPRFRNPVRRPRLAGWGSARHRECVPSPSAELHRSAAGSGF